MQALFARIRWRLVGWNMLILGLILVLLGGSVYVALSRSLLDEVDRNLLSRSDQAMPFLFPDRRPDGAGPGGPPGGGGGGPRRAPHGYSGGGFFPARLAHRTALAQSQQAQSTAWRPAETGMAPLATDPTRDCDDAPRGR